MVGPDPMEDQEREAIERLMAGREAAELERREYRRKAYDMTNQSSPDDAAEALKLGEQFGVPRQAIELDPKVWKQRNEEARRRLLAESSPRTMAWMDNIDNHAVAKDEVDLWGSVEGFFGDLARDPLTTGARTGAFVGRSFKAGFMSAESSIADIDREQLEKAARYYDDLDAWKAREAERVAAGKGGFMGRLGFNTVDVGTLRMQLPGDTDPMPQPTARLLDEAANRNATAFEKFLGIPSADYKRSQRDVVIAIKPLIQDKMREAVRVSEIKNKAVEEMMPQTGDFLADSLLGGVRAISEMTPLMVSAIASRGKTIPTAVMAGQVYYNEYATGREKGLEIDQATERAVLQAGVEAVSERISLGIVDNVLKDGGPLALRFTKGLILEQGQEQVATMGGRLVDWNYLEKDKTIQEFIDETPRAMLQTALTTLVASSGMQATFLAADYATQKFLGDSVMTDPSKGDKFIANVMEKFAKANLGKRSPERAADLVNKIVEGTGAETVVIDLDGLAQSLTTAGMDVRETLTQLGVDPDAIGELGQLMGTAEIPMGRLASPSAQLLSAQIVPHMRLATEDLTPFQKTELEDIAELAKRYTDELKEDIARDASKLGAFVDVQEQIYTALKGSGINLTEEQYRHNANVEATRVAYVAMKRGQDVRETFAELGPKIMGRDGAAQGGAALQQKADEMRTRLDEAWTSSRTMQPKEAARVWKNAVEEFKTFAASASAQELIAASDMLLDRELLLKMEAPKLEKMMKTLGLPAPGPMMALNEMRDAITAALRSANAGQTESSDPLAQSIRAASRMPMDQVKQWVIDNTTSTESDFPNGDVLTVVKFPLTEDPDAPEVMLSIRLKERASNQPGQTGRADVHLFLENQMADALDSVEDPAQRSVLAKTMFAKAVLVMRQYAAEYDVKAFNFIAAESQAEGTNPKSREALYRYMLSTLNMDGYTAYELDSQMSVVREQDGVKSAEPLFPGSGFVIVKDGVNVEEYARNEIIRGSQRGGDAGEVVTVLTATRLGRADTGDRGARGRGEAGEADPGSVRQGAENLTQPRRGGYDPKTREMSLSGISDASTFLHENSHWFLATLEELAPTEQWAADDLAEINSWYQSIRETPKMTEIRLRYSVIPEGEAFRIIYDPPADMIGNRPPPMKLERVASMEEAQAKIEWRERQEAWAETTEEYFMTGESPTPRLKQILRDFKNWLVGVYRGMLPGERANLTPEIKSMMDRILAVDVEVDAASAEVFRDARKMADEMLGKGIITPRQHKLVGDRLDKAREEVKEELLARVMQEKLDAAQASRATERSIILGNLARAFDKSPVGRAFNWLAYGEWKGDLPGAPATKGEAESARSDEVLFSTRPQIVSELQAQGFNTSVKLYHGGLENLGMGTNTAIKADRYRPFWVTPDEGYARSYGPGRGGQISAFYTNIKNPADLARMAQELLPIYNADQEMLSLNPDALWTEADGDIAEQAFVLANSPRVMDYLVEQGYDAVTVEERPGVRSYGIINPANIRFANADDGGTLGQSAARLQGSPLAIKGSGPGGRVLNWDLGMAFTERHMKKYGRALDPADPADYKIILKSMLQDFKEQSAQQDTGDAWYTDDINEAIALTAQIYPELNTSTQFRDLFLTVTALLSPQQKPVQNWENAILAMRSWRETGRIEFLKPSGKQYGVLSHTTGLKMFQHLVDTIGLEAALVWVKTEHTGREVAEMRMASGLFSPIDKATGKVSTKVKDYLASETNLNESLLGIYGFGPKVGDFMQNSVGIDQNAVTVDLWLARTYNRLIGRLTDVSPKQAEDGGIASEIRGRAEREHIKRLVRDAAKKAGLDPSAMQAALWYFEQRLYRAHGIKSDSQNFSGAARTALQTRAIDVRSSESNQRTAGQDVREGVRGGGSQQAGDGRGSDQGRSYAPLAGAPGNLQGPIPELVAVAEQYARQAGINLRRQAKYADVDADRGARIAQAYEDMKHAPNDPAVQEAYADLIRQTRAQYEALVEAGYVFTFFDGASDPYAGNPSAAMRDLRNNKRMAVYGTYDGYGTEGITAGALADNPMLADTGLQWADQSGVMRPVVANDLFRAVHDAMGHGLEGAGFRARGEENAWQAHVRLFTGPAVGAITSETRGQNSWLNYGPYGETNRTATLENTIFAEQKTGLMPEWTWIEGRVADMTTDTNETLSQTKAPIFYSALSRFIENNKTTKAPAAQWKGMITNAPGIKVEEVEMSGVMDWLDLQQGPVTREALAAFVAANGVTVEEVVRGAPLGGNNVRLEEIQREMLPLIEERDRIRLRQQELNAKIESRTVTDEEKREYKANSNRFVELGDLLDPLQQEQYNLSSPSGADTKWSSHTLPGGENYTELLLKLPVEQSTMQQWRVMRGDGQSAGLFDSEEGAQSWIDENSNTPGFLRIERQPDIQFNTGFRSSHWSEPNVLAHARFKERIGPNGERVLALEEIQSDWHQAGREGGYQDPKAMADARAEADKASADRAQAFEDMKAALVRDDVQKLVSSAGTQQERDIVASLSSGQVSRNPMSIDIVRNAVAAHMRNPRLSEESRAAMMGSYEAFRAATSMFDVATRYTSSLSRNVPNAPFKNNAWVDLVLKRMIRYAAENGFDSVAWIPGNVQNGKVVEADDNRSDFYDKIVPNAANKLGKKYGARVEKTAGLATISYDPRPEGVSDADWFNMETTPTDLPVDFWTLPITPELREAALSEGFPLFQPRKFNPPGHGAIAPPADIPPVRLDLKLVKDLYGEEAVRKLPAAVRQRSSTSSNVTDIIQQIEAVRKVLSVKRKGPQTLTQFIMQRQVKQQDGSKRNRQWGIKGAAGELRAMGLERLINEKSGMTLDAMRELAEEAGFIRAETGGARATEYGDLDATPNDLLDALAREAKGENVVRIGEEADNKELDDAKTWASWLEQNGVDIYEASPKKLRASVDAMLRDTDESLVSPDKAAEMFGFANGEELLKALAEVGNRDAFLNKLADQKMVEEFGDMMSDGTLQAEAAEAARLDIAHRQTEIELEALARAVGQQASANYAKSLARDIIAMRTVKEIAAYERDLNNERQFAKQALRLVEKGDYPAALKAKQRQLVSMQLYIEGKKANEKIEKRRQDLLKYYTSEGRRDKIAGDYLEKIEDILDRFELRVSKQGPSVQRERMSAAKYVADMDAAGRQDEVAPEARLLAELNEKMVWRNMTGAEVDHLVGTIQNLAHLGRTKDSLLRAAEKRKFRAVIDALTDRMNLTGKLPGVTRERSPTKTKSERAVDVLREGHSWLMRPEHQARSLDGGELGPVWEAIFRPISEAGDVESRMMREATQLYREAWDKFTGAERNAMTQRSISVPELPGIGKRFTKMDLISVALNWGVIYNREVLMEGYGWTPEQVEAALFRVLTDKDWDFVESIWEISGMYKAEAFQVEKDMTGVEPKAVEGIPFTLPSGRKISGKYYHIDYDASQPGKMSRRQAKDNDAEALSSHRKSRTKAMTKNGGLIERKGSGGRKVKLGLAVFEKALAETVHDIAFRRAVYDVGRIIADDQFADTYQEVAGMEAYRQLNVWLKDVAMPPMEVLDPIVKAFAHVRRNVPLAVMGYKIGTALIQPTGLLAAMPLVGHRRVLVAVAKSFANPDRSMYGAWKQVASMSEFMRDRVAGYERDVRETTTAMTKGGALDVMRRNAFTFITGMDIAVSVPTWMAAYGKAMDGKVKGIDAGNQEDAVAFADSIIRRTQTAGKTQDLSRFQRGGEFQKQVSMIFGYFNNLYSLTAQQTLDMRRGNLSKAQYAWHMTVLFVAIPLFAELLAGRLIPDDDDEDEATIEGNIATTLISNFSGMFPGIRDVVALNLKPEFGYRMSPTAKFAEDIGKTLGLPAQLMLDEERELTEADVKRAVNAAGAVTGLPAAQINITGGFIVDTLQGEEDPMEDPMDALSEGLVRSTR